VQNLTKGKMYLFINLYIIFVCVVSELYLLLLYLFVLLILFDEV
jgi:hypothetical protein